MKPRDVFKIIVASVGVLGFGYGVIDLVDGVLFSLQLVELQYSEPKYYAWRGVLEIILSVLFIKSTPWFVGLAFPPDKPSPSVKTDENTNSNA